MKLGMAGMTLAERCVVARGDRSYADIARRGRLSRDYPRQVETGLIVSPSAKAGAQLAEGYGVRVEWLLFNSGPMRDDESDGGIS